MRIIQIGIMAGFILSGAYVGWCAGVLVTHYATCFILSRSFSDPGVITPAAAR